MMSGMTERDEPIFETFTGFIGSLSWPFIRASWRRKIRKYKEEHRKRELPPWP